MYPVWQYRPGMHVNRMVIPQCVQVANTAGEINPPTQQVRSVSRLPDDYDEERQGRAIDLSPTCYSPQRTLDVPTVLAGSGKARVRKVNLIFPF